MNLFYGNGNAQMVALACARKAWISFSRAIDIRDTTVVHADQRSDPMVQSVNPKRCAHMHDMHVSKLESDPLFDQKCCAVFVQ